MKCKTCNGSGSVCCGPHNVSCTDCGGTGKPTGKFTVERRVTCGCCAGSGTYQPLVGPAEPCGTCKGEKTVVVSEVSGVNEIVTEGLAGEIAFRPNILHNADGSVAVDCETVDSGINQRKLDKLSYYAGQARATYPDKIEEIDQRYQAEARRLRASDVVVKIGPVDDAKLREVLAKKQEFMQTHQRVWRMSSQNPIRGEAANVVTVDEVPEYRGWPYSACHPELVALHDAGKLSYGMLILVSELPWKLQLENLSRLQTAHHILDEVRGQVNRWKKNERFARAYGAGPNWQNLPKPSDEVPAMIQPNESVMPRERAVAYNFQLQMENARTPAMDKIMREFYNEKLGVPHTPDLEFTGRMDV